MSGAKLSEGDFIVLGQLVLLGRASPYDIEKASSGQVPHTVYRMMTNLERRGLVEKLGGPIPVGKGPAKQHWRVTDAGIQAFRHDFTRREQQLGQFRSIV